MHGFKYSSYVLCIEFILLFIIITESCHTYSYLLFFIFKYPSRIPLVYTAHTCKTNYLTTI